MRKRLSWILHLFVICVSLSIASGPGDEGSPPLPEKLDGDSGWVYGRIEYEHDLLAPNLYFLELLASPGGKVPMIGGGYASTDVHAIVRLRGVDVPRALHGPSERHRPHLWRDQERERWNAAMQYVWNVCEPTKTFRVHNMVVIDEDRVIEADIEFWLGGAFHNLAVSLCCNDEHASPCADGRLDVGSWESELRLGEPEYSAVSFLWR